MIAKSKRCDRKEATGDDKIAISSDNLSQLIAIYRNSSVTKALLSTFVNISLP